MCSIHTIDTPVARMLADRVDQLEHLGLGQAAGDLVEQQQLRLRRQRPGELEALAVEQRQRAPAMTLALSSMPVRSQRLDRRRLGRCRAAGPTRAERAADEHVLEHA